MEPITNRVADSEIEVYNLAEHWDGAEVVELDISPFLVEGLMLKEEPFREDVESHDWRQYEGTHVAIHCATDAIVPMWAYMLVAAKLDGIARSTAFGARDDLLREYFARALEREDWSAYEGRPVVIKGCGGEIVPVSAYLTATRKLKQVARKLMFGEPCSSVPLWRRPTPESEKPESEKPQREAVGVKKPELPT